MKNGGVDRDGPNYTLDEPPMDMVECFQSYVSTLKMRLFGGIAQWVVNLDPPYKNQRSTPPKYSAPAQFEPVGGGGDDDCVVVHADRE